MNHQILLLDLGGVVVDLNVERFHESCEKLGIENPQQFFSFSAQSDLITQFEIGRITEQDFLLKFSSHLSQPTSNEIIKQVWCSMIDGIQSEVIETLRALKNRYQLYALSNTNSLHVDYMNNLLAREYAIPSLRSLFTDCFFSFEVNARKPSLEYFEKFLKLHALDKSKMLFIDDLPKNTAAAERTGIKSLTKPRDVPLAEFLKKHNIIA
jgi:putative hydrolase of the HAD superfamily